MAGRIPDSAIKVRPKSELSQKENALNALAVNDPAKFGENKSAVVDSPAKSRLTGSQVALGISPVKVQAPAAEGGSLEKIQKLEREIAALEARLTRKKGATIRGHRDVSIYTAIIKKLKHIERLKSGSGRTRRTRGRRSLSTRGASRGTRRY
jgi:hypothetical protein